MLQTLDVLIGFTLVMLVMSMAVTMVTQFVGTWAANLKGEALCEGIAQLLAMLDRGLSVDDARRIAVYILSDPLIGRPDRSGTQQLAPVVHREELVKLILDFAGKGEASEVADQLGTPGSPEEKQQLQHRLRASLARNGIADPKAALDAIRLATLDLERVSPELSNSMRAAKAILDHAESLFLAKLNNWFDQTMDRVSAVFTARIRSITFIISLGVALLFQVNAFELINRLSVDDKLRNKVVSIAIDRVKQGAPKTTGASTGAGATTNTAAAAPANGADATSNAATNAAENAADAAATNVTGNAAGAAATNVTGNAAGAAATNVTENAATTNATAETPDAAAAKAIAEECVAPPASGPDPRPGLRTAVHQCVGQLGDVGLIAFPKSWDDWRGEWGQTGSSALWQFIGILLSAALLSLGAPFWYSLLSNLVRLRSVVARKDDIERAERQLTQPPAGAAPNPPPQNMPSRSAPFVP